MELLDGNGWLNSHTQETQDCNGRTKVNKGMYLICNGGYHCWPCMMFPIKLEAAGSPFAVEVEKKC
jgi:hypothetical protein